MNNCKIAFYSFSNDDLGSVPHGDIKTIREIQWRGLGKILHVSASRQYYIIYWTLQEELQPMRTSMPNYKHMIS